MNSPMSINMKDNTRKSRAKSYATSANKKVTHLTLSKVLPLTPVFVHPVKTVKTGLIWQNEKKNERGRNDGYLFLLKRCRSENGKTSMKTIITPL